MRLTQKTKDYYPPSGYTGEISPFPGCATIAVSYGVHKLYGGGFGSWANKVRCNQLRDLGYSSVICTVDSSNVKQIEIMNSNEWKELTRFKSKQTGHIVILFFKEL